MPGVDQQTNSEDQSCENASPSITGGRRAAASPDAAALGEQPWILRVSTSKSINHPAGFYMQKIAAPRGQSSPPVSGVGGERGASQVVDCDWLELLSVRRDVDRNNINVSTGRAPGKSQEMRRG